MSVRGRIVRANTQMETLLGYSRAELLSQPIEALIPERFKCSSVSIAVETPVTFPVGLFQ